jgi:peptidoglycan hydrolase CwlO-like protein
MSEHKDVESRRAELEQFRKTVAEEHEALMATVKKLEHKVTALEHQVAELKIKVDYVESEAP